MHILYVVLYTREVEAIHLNFCLSVGNKRVLFFCFYFFHGKMKLKNFWPFKNMFWCCNNFFTASPVAPTEQSAVIVWVSYSCTVALWTTIRPCSCVSELFTVYNNILASCIQFQKNHTPPPTPTTFSELKFLE